MSGECEKCGAHVMDGCRCDHLNKIMDEVRNVFENNKASDTDIMTISEYFLLHGCVILGLSKETLFNLLSNSWGVIVDESKLNKIKNILEILNDMETT
jgi:hypothetical protein